jgi:hypothetical protein
VDKVNYNLFLDDERNVADVKWVQYPLVHWVVVRNYQEFVDTVVKNGIPNRVSFDHDLGKSSYKEYQRCFLEKDNRINYDNIQEKTGIDCVRWLIEKCMENNQKFPEYYVHSLNPIGKVNIVSLIECFKKFNFH